MSANPGAELPEEFIFPLQISEMRKAYQRDGLLGGGKLSMTGAAERLSIPPDEAGPPRDLPRSYTPASSAALDEMSLTQLLTMIGHRRYRAVGIVASNPFDVVFLARQVRLFCPNVRLFAIQPDLLLTRPQEISYLRGMLVASTYPLYPPNQWLSASGRAQSHVFFSDQGSQGLYNATVAHLWEMGVSAASGSEWKVEPLEGVNVTARPKVREPVFALADLTGSVRLRVFDRPGHKVMELNEKKPVAAKNETGPLTKLASRWPRQQPSASETRQIIASVTSLVGHCIPSAPALLEFGAPYDTKQAKDPRPPIWISAVGTRGLYPIECFPDEPNKYPQDSADSNASSADEGREPRDYLYSPSDNPEKRAVSSTSGVNSAASHDVLPHAHPLFGLLFLFLITACFWVAGFTWCYWRWEFDKKKAVRKPYLIRFGGRGIRFAHPLKFFNAEVAEDVQEDLAADGEFRAQERFGTDPNPPRVGARLYVPFVNLLVVVPSWYVFLLCVDVTAPLILTNGQKFFLVLAVASVIAATSSFLLSAVCSFWPWLPTSAAKSRPVTSKPLREELDELRKRLHVLKEGMLPSLKDRLERSRNGLPDDPVDKFDKATQQLDTALVSVVDRERLRLSQHAQRRFDLVLKGLDCAVPKPDGIGQEFECEALKLDRENLKVARENLKVARENLTLRREALSRDRRTLSGDQKKYSDDRSELEAKRATRDTVRMNRNGDRPAQAVAQDTQVVSEEKKRLAEEQERLAQEEKRLAKEKIRLAKEKTRLAKEKTRLARDEKRLRRGEERVDLKTDFLKLASERRLLASTFPAMNEHELGAINDKLRESEARIEELRERATLWNQLWISLKAFYSSRRIVYLLLLTLVVACFATRFFRDNSALGRRLEFERVVNIPSGVSPYFSVLFLAVALGAWVYAQLSQRRLYRHSYLNTTQADMLAKKIYSEKLPFDELLFAMRKKRETLNILITKLHKGLEHTNRSLNCVLLLFFAIVVIRVAFRGPPRSFEGIVFDRVFWGLALAVFCMILAHSLQLLGLWRNTSEMLKLAVDLPMTEAFNRLPTSYKYWFFGAEDFAVRKQLVLQQMSALRHRINDRLIKVYEKLYETSGAPRWRDDFAELEQDLGNLDDSLDASRSVYGFLRPLWGSLSVEDNGSGVRRDHETTGVSADSKLSRPLLTANVVAPEPEAPPEDSGAGEHHENLTDRAKTVTPEEHKLIRDWVRTAEDLIALQIVRWFARALSQLLPIITFLVVGSLSLFLAVSSYPFDQQGWLMTVMVLLLLLVASVVGKVLIGVNRNELISRVSGTVPGRLTFDSGFVAQMLTTIVPLLAALLAVSFDLSDILHTLLGPIFEAI